MAQRPRDLDPLASPEAMFGAELRALRLDRHLSLARLGRQVHVSSALLCKIEKAQRKPGPDLVECLDRVLETDGALARLAAEIPGFEQPDPVDKPAIIEPAAAPALRGVVDGIRAGDHAMGAADRLSLLLAHARANERTLGRLRGPSRVENLRALGESYQLAGWMSFDSGDSRRAERLLGSARSHAEDAGDAGLTAFVLGPNLSFASTYGGNPALGVERGYGAMGWARRSGNHRLTAFAMAIAARGHARLGETALALDLLDQASDELGRHDPETPDPTWLAVFDASALEGHRGSCLLDLGQLDRAVEHLHAEETSASGTFVRNRVIWQLDRADAYLRLRELDRACADINAAAALIEANAITARVIRRFRVAALALRKWDSIDVVRDTRERLQLLIEANA